MEFTDTITSRYLTMGEVIVMGFYIRPKHMMTGFLTFFLSVFSLGCTSNEIQHSPLTAEEKEQEKIHTQTIVTLLQKQMTSDYKAPPMHRGAHAKQHGCTKGVLTVEPNLPAHLKMGVFNQKQHYSAYVRYSNSSHEQTSDTKKAVRGMAIKLLDVENTLPFLNQAQTEQDFILISHPVLPIGTLEKFAKIIEKNANSHILWFFFNPFDSHLRELNLARKASKQHENPLDTAYWSTTPYAFGDRVVKYIVRPTSNNLKQAPNQKSENKLRETMKKQLEQQAATFDFFVQFQTHPEKMPIEDASIEWSEIESVPIKVATLHLPPQTFDTAEMNSFCEQLSFNPWHAHVQHEPLGGINRARKQIYEASFQLRNGKK